MQILLKEKEGDEKMARKRIYLAFLLILGMLVFASCARYDGVPNVNPNDRVMDNDGIRNNGGMNGTDVNRNNADNNGGNSGVGGINGGNTSGGSWNNTTNNGQPNNHNLGR
jgi:hypothetical protein